MRSDVRSGLMKKYFLVYNAQYPSFSNIIRISLGMMLFGSFIIYYFENTIIAGTILILLGLTLFILWITPYFRDLKLYKERPADKQINNWFIEDLNEVIKQTAIQKLRLNMKTLKPENFLIVPYPIYWQIPGVDNSLIMRRMNDSGEFAYTIWNVQVLALTENYISFYTCTYDWLNNRIINEKSNEFFYEDISSVKNDIKPIERYLVDKEYVDEEGNKLNADKLTATIFKVTNMSSESLKVITNIVETKHSQDFVVSLEKAVQALRVILRKRRHNEEQEPIIIEKEETQSDENEQ
ncbi:MAG: hypothetical protein JXR51_08870 [Bacteroidales bacterium]|nr:hypothetical protein [Bacteroidales bacterium]MBN2757276.1 hypothetical protein [Bacteroidales bacterium]